MAIDTWATGTLDPSATSKPDRTDHRNKITGAAADGGAVTLAIDSAIITRMTLLRSLVENLMSFYSGRLPP